MKIPQTIDWSNPENCELFERFFARMPDDQRELAIASLNAAKLPTSQEFLKAYTMGIAVMSAVILDGLSV